MYFTQSIKILCIPSAYILFESENYKNPIFGTSHYIFFLCLEYCTATLILIKIFYLLFMLNSENQRNPQKLYVKDMLLKKTYTQSGSQM